jgi:deazaflavin-dependent oxidoreductase (nitroreductase family)
MRIMRLVACTASGALAAERNVRVYRLGGGRLGSAWGKAPILLLTTSGRRTGGKRTTPVLYLDLSGSFAVVATNNGAPRHPAWYLNLQAEPHAQVQVKSESIPVLARTASGEERAALWPRLVAMYPNYESDQQRTERELPVVILERA